MSEPAPTAAEPWIRAFPGASPSTLDEVGGKGLSLLRLAAAGLPVPPGIVVVSRFFDAWIEQVQASPAWAELRAAAPENWRDRCLEVQELCGGLAFTSTQSHALDELRQALASSPDDEMATGWLAVRSSSPDEDLASASFAGGYTTRLGVSPRDLAEAIRACFASCLDHRVLVYKEQHGFDPFAPRLAVIVQRQLDSEVSGVGFSLDPHSNDYDHAVIDACWGLGEALVSGRTTPDHFRVDKVTGEILERNLGAKEISFWLGPDGGTLERRGHRTGEATLGDGQLAELTTMLGRIEELFASPVDVEWAYAQGRLHLLQARPITTYVPLPPEMLTRPGEKRRLYADAALAKGLTINAPISPMGLDWMRSAAVGLFERFSGAGSVDTTPQGNAMVFFAGGRMYSNLSSFLWLVTPRQLAKGNDLNDALMAETIANIDRETYRPESRPSWLRLGSLWVGLKILWQTRDFFSRMLWAILAPQRSHATYHRQIEAFHKAFRSAVEEDLPLPELRTRLTGPVTQTLFDSTMWPLGAGFAGLGLATLLAGKKSPERRALAERLQLGFPGNVVAEMGITLYRMARRLPVEAFDDLPALAEKIERRELDAETLKAWDRFLAEYGRRGPLEMDLARPRYADDPVLALRQMSFMAGETGFDPEAAHQRQIDARRAAAGELERDMGWLRRRLFRRACTLIELFAGTRDTPKHLNLLFHQEIRHRALEEGWRLTEQGRLDRPEDVFELELRDLEAAVEDPDLDLRALREERAGFHRLLESRVRSFPPVIDSRGRILRPAPKPEAPGELRGMAVSPGVVRGPVKVLEDPYQKPIEPGDVLVAYTTDPGWTPLFVNAAAVVLEVGGVLQHGAVVAREYGKPCVAGIQGVLTRLRDGEPVEVDGTTGVVRRLEAVEL